LTRLGNGVTGQVLIATTGAAPSWSSTPTFSGLTLSANPATSAGDVFLCISTAGVVRQGATCLASAERFKDNITPLAHGLDWLTQFTPSTYTWKYNGSTGMSLIADNVAGIDPQLAIYQDGQIYSLNDRAIQAVVVKAIQEMNLNLESLGADVVLTPVAPGSFAERVFKNIKAQIGTWLADASNGIGSIFTKEINTKTLCVSDDTGAKTCLTKAQLDTLLGNANSSIVNNTAGAADAAAKAADAKAAADAAAQTATDKATADAKAAADAKASADKIATDAKAAADLAAQKIADEKAVADAAAKAAADKAAADAIPPSP
jgi:hypothetical protein